MKAFSFLTILESLSKKLSILRTKMHSDNLRVDYESITSQLRVSRPFSHCASSGASFGLSRRASHFAAILTILFTVGVGSVWGETTLFDVDFSDETDETISTTEESAVFVSKTYDGYGMSFGVKAKKDIKITNGIGLVFEDNNYNSYSCLAIPLTLTANNEVTVVITLAKKGKIKYGWHTDELPETPSAPDGTTYDTEETTNTITYTPTTAGTYVLYLGRSGSSSGHQVKSIKITQSAPSSGECADPSLSYSNETITKTFGDAAFTNTLTNTNGVAVTYSSTNENVATVANNGQVTIVGAGTTTIKATWAGNATYCEAEASYTLTVAKANINPTLTYSNTSLAIGGTANPTINGNTGSGAVTYSSSNTNIATVDANGVVTAKAEGTATITANIAATANYNGRTATATINVNATQDPDQPSTGCTIIIKATPTGKTSATVSGSLAGSAYFNGQTDYKLGSQGHYIGVSLKSGEKFQSGDKIILGVSAANSASMLYLHSDGTGGNQLATISQTLVVGENKFDIPNAVVGQSSLYIYREDSKCNPTVESLSICRPTSSETPEPEQVPQVGTFTGMGMSGSVNLYWTMPTKPVTTRVDIASATLSAAVGQSDGATSTRTKENTNEIKVEYSTDGGWKATGVQIPLATPQKNVESITFEYKSASNQSVDLIPFLYDGTTRWVESGFAKLTPTEWTSHTSVITKQAWVENLYSTDKTIESVNFYANPATATSGTFYIRNVVLNQGTQVAAEGLIIVRKVGSNPTSPTDGTQVYDGDGIAATCTDNGLTNGTTYHYAAYAHDGQGNYSEPLYWQYTYKEGVNTYAPDDTDFPNPERGFYEQVQWNANKGYNAVIGDSYFDDARAASRSLILRIYYMDSNELRQNDQLPAAFITMFNEDMEKFRTNGMKCILRFAYDENSGDGYQDASPETWATHLAQLKTHLEANADVIYVVQAGFLGVWGEWYYSSQGTGNDEISEEIKNNLIDQLLAAVPANRCVQLRTPLFKKEYLGNNNPLTLETAYNGTAQARLGHHNDAFLNGAANQGTYENREADMAYIAQECLYVPIGGETNLEESEVNDLYDKYCKGTVAEAEMAQLHYSYLNYSYSTVVTNRWREEGSYARMSKQLGYRFELESATLPNEATAGTQMNVQLNIKNVGYAPLYNERHAYIVLKNNTNTYSIKLSSDPRTWDPNKVTTTINENVTLPVDMLAGTYDLYLYLPDASASIAADPKYAVRFANQGIWESETGYNKLNKQVVVTATDLATYTITFKNGETVLQESQVNYGETPAYNGATPTKAEDAQYTYTFSGWSPAISAVTGNATYIATFNQTAKNYTLTWDVNGGNALTGDYTKGTIAYGTVITKPADPTREGYTFAGWSPAVAATMPAANTTYTAQWEEIKVASITVNPATLDLKKGESATVTATISPADALNKTVTWANTSITTLSSETGNSITVTGKSNGKDKELKASAGGKQATVEVSVYYEVQYNSNGGSACTAGKCYDSNGVTLPTPTRDGYTFAGWYKNEALTQSAGAAGDTYKPSDNITLYAKWTVAKTNPTTTWTVAETAYAGQLVSVSVTTNSDATLTTGSLTTNKGTLVNATVNGQTITATLQVPDDASDDITLTLTTVATENYNASTSTKTITLSECPTNGGGGEEVIYSMYLTGQTACSVTGGTASLSKVSSTTLTVNKKSYYKFDSSTKITISPTNGIKSGDKLIVDIASTDANAVGFYLKNSDNTLATCTTTIAKESATTITYTFTKDVPIVDITRTDSNLRFYGASITRASGSGSGESTLETNLAWSTDLSAEVSKQAGTTFTYTASSNNSAGAITYSSSDENIATVNPTTGEVTTKAAGTAIITANIAEIGCYPTKSITYTLTVTSTDEPEPTTYTVTYNLGGGTGTLPTQAATKAGGTFTLASADGITKSGYTFAGWNDGTTTYAAGATYTMPASNVTLTAQWTPETYNINYYEAVGEVNDINGLNKISIDDAPTSYTILDAVTLPALPAKDGYTATGWYSQYCVFEDGGNGKGWAGCETTLGHNAGYYGHANYIVKYTLNTPVTPDPEPGSYTLTYDENKPAVWNDDFAFKNIPEAQTLTNGTGNVSTNTPVITEDADSDYAIYTFAGWNTAADGKGTSYAAGAPITITENTTLYAQWTPCTFDVKYFDQDKETPLEGMVNTTYTFGVGIPNLPTPTKPGHTFTGWKLFYDGEGGTIIEEPVVSLANDIWGVLQLAAQWEVNCTMPTTTFANTKYTIGPEALNLSDFIDNNNSGGAITYAVTGGVAATINGSSFTCDRIGVVTVTATQAANGGYCEKIMTATINVAMPVQGGCAQMFTFDANDKIENPDGQKGSSYLDLSSYATINGLSTTGKVGIKDMDNNNKTSTTLIDENEIYFPNTNTYLKVENLSTPLAAGDKISIGTQQSATEYIITISGTQCTSNCITTEDQQYTIPTGSSLIGVTTFYIWAKTEQTHLRTINICRPAYEITYKANNGTAAADVVLNDAVLVAGCPNTFTEPAGKQFAGWNTAANGSGTSYSVGTIIPVNNLELYAQWECIEPVFTVSCDKTAYSINDEASEITVTVTAGNSGGVTYQWYASDKNDRTTGTAITGAIAASYTPSTDKEGTTYYWCEISNSCTTVKTPTIAITVTVNKHDANVEWTYFDATPTQGGTIHYGGGSYMITAQVVEDWNGTLTADMLTAPDGIYVYGAMAQGNTISAYFDVTTSFDRVANPNTIPFYLSLPETDEYDPLVSIGNVPYEACTTGGESGTVILAADGTNKLKTWKNGNFSVTCNTKNGAQKTYVKPSANDTFEFSTTGGETILSVDIYHSASTSLSESTKTIITAPNTTSNLNYFTVSEANNNKIIVKATNQCYVFKTVVTYISGNGEDVSLEWDTEDDLTNQVEKKQSDPNFTYKATPSTNTLGTITYSSSNTNVATVNPNTGEVEIVATGVEEQTTTITATLAPSGCYKGATATYTISVAGMDCEISAGTLALTNGAENKCSGESVTLALTGYTADGTTIQWYKGDAIIEGATTATYTTAEPGTYSVLVTDNNNNACAKRSNTITITNISAEASVTNIVNTWYIKSGRLTPPIALWKLDEGTTFQSVQVSDGWADGTGFAQDAFFENEGIVYLTGTPPQANETGEDKTYTLTLKVKDVCGGEHTIPSTITIVHQKNTDKHVLAFVVTGTEKGGFTEGITTAQTTNVPLYNEISQVFDVLATNIYATDNEQLLKEYYSRFDIICITDYPNTKEIGVNGKSYTDAMGALIDIRPIFSMEAWVSNLPNWNDKGVKGEPVSPTTRQYSMLLQCKDHEIFAGTTLITEGSGDEEMYRVIMVDKNQEEYATLDRDYGNTDPHTATKEEGGYQYSDKPALQGFRYESSLSSMLPIGTIEDGARKIIQVGLERQQEEEARMMVVGVNSYAMERLTDDGETVIINTLKYLMKKSAEDISDCSIFFDNKAGDNQWNNPANWGPSYNSVPLSYQGARILEPCIVSDVVAKAAKVKIATSGTYDKGAKEAKGSLTIAPNGALVVGGVISEVTAPNYYEIRPTQAENLIVKAEDEADSQHRLGALIHDNKNGETSATIQMWNPSHWEIEGTKKKKYWSYVAVPIQEAPIPEFFYHGFTYLYDETQGWIKKGDGTVLYPFQGIGASLQTGNMETFYGKLATTDDQDIILTKTTGVGEGQNLIGNSWTAPIQIANFEEEDFNDATATVYVYNTGRDEQASGAIGTPSYGESNSTQAGQWISVPVNTAKENAYTGLKVIPAMNAFQVNTAQETELHLNYNRLVRGEGKGGVNSESNLNQPMRAPHKPIEALMRIRVAGEKTHTDMWLLQDERFDYGFDNGWEAEFVEGDDRSAQLYAVSEIGKMAFLAQPELDGTLLGFAPSRDGAEYTFSFYYTGSQKLYLNDLKLQTSTLVSDNDTYLFTYEKGDEQRFIISTAPFNIPDISTGVGNTTNGENAKAVKFIKDDKIFIFVNGTLYDATGKMVIR